MTNPNHDPSRPVEAPTTELTPEEIAAVRAALARTMGNAAGPMPAWLADRPAAVPEGTTGSGLAGVHGGAQTEPPLAPWLTSDPVAPRNVVPLAIAGVATREGAMRNRPPLSGRRRADALPTRALAAAAGVAVTLGLVVVLVPPDSMVATGAQSSGDPASDGSASANQGVAAVSPSDVVESAAPSPVPAASKAGKAKATPKPGKNAATARPASGGGSGTSSGGSSSSSSSGAKATAKPTAQATSQPPTQATAKPTAQPTAQPKPQPTPQPTAQPTPQPTPVPTAASGKP